MTKPEELTITELKKTNPITRRVNRELMIAWINEDLPNRMGLDVRKSFVLYDNDKTFQIAMFNELSQRGKAAVAAASNIRYWSKGIV